MKPKSAHRYRICGTPVRTGCITCKIRRVKCGEEKPFCKRCTSTGRKCDGYAPVNQPAQGRKSSPQAHLSENIEDPMEQKIFHFFCTTSAPKLPGYFSNDFWGRRVLQASAVEPSIRHAVIAIGAVHHDFISRHESIKVHDPSIIAFAFRQYTKAISHLHRLMSTRTQQLDFTLISCILFISFDCISGNHDSAIIHLKAGLKILEDVKKRNVEAISPEQTTSAHEWEKEFAPLLLGLGVQAASFVNPKYLNDRAALWAMLKGARIPTHPTTFHSIDEARHALESTIADIMADRTATDNRVLACQIQNPKGAQRLKHTTAMTSWIQALNRYLGTYAARETDPNTLELAVNILKLQWLALSIEIGIPEPSYDRFEKIVTYCESLVPEHGSSPLQPSALNFSTDIGIICPLFLTSLRAPRMSTRRQAFELLSRAPRREGMWDSDDAVLIAGGAIRDIDELGDFGNTTLPDHTPEYEFMMWNDISSRLKTRFTWPFAEEQDTTTLSTSFVRGFPFIRSDPVGPGHSTTVAEGIKRPDHWRVQ